MVGAVDRVLVDGAVVTATEVTVGLVVVSAGEAAAPVAPDVAAAAPEVDPDGPPPVAGAGVVAAVVGAVVAAVVGAVVVAVLAEPGVVVAAIAPVFEMVVTVVVAAVLAAVVTATVVVVVVVAASLVIVGGGVSAPVTAWRNALKYASSGNWPQLLVGATQINPAFRALANAAAAATPAIGVAWMICHCLLAGSIRPHSLAGQF